MGHDDLIEIRRADAKWRQRRIGRRPDRTAPRRGLVIVITGIHQDHFVATPEDPHEIIHRVGRRMIIIQDETVLTCTPVPVGIFDGVNLPRGHGQTSA